MSARRPGFIVPRRNFLRGSAFLGAMAIPTIAEANTPFVNYGFSASGATTRRTMPDRIADVKNVKDFGAKGDGSQDDAPAINNAINWTSNVDRGTIYFPAGFYDLRSAVLSLNAANINIQLVGQNGGSTFLNNTVAAQYLIDRSLVSPSYTGQVTVEKLSLNGGIRLGSCQMATVREVECSWISTEDSPGNSSQNVSLRSVNINGGGLIHGGSGVIQGCDWISCDVAARLYGRGWAYYGNRIEECNTALLIGVDSGVVTTFTGTVAPGVLTVTSAVAGGTIKPWQKLEGSGVGPGIFIVSQASGTSGGGSGATYNLTNPTFTISTPQSFNLTGNDKGASGFVLHGGSTEGNWNGAIYAGTCTGFYHGSMGFLGHSNSGPLQNLATQYHLVVGANSSNGMFQGLYGLGDLAAVAGGRVDTAASRANLLFTACTLATHGGGGVDWILPTNAYTAQFMLCNTQPVWTFAGLPTGGNVLAGDMFVISDPNTNTWGANVTGSGALGQCLVRWNGSNWTVVGK